MPLPIGHSLAGYTLYEGHHSRLNFFRHRWATIAFFVVLANLADIDFLPGYLAGNPNLYHHGPVHSLGAALLVGLLGGLFFGRRYGHFWRYFGIIAAVYYSHLVLDFFNNDTREPLGVMLLWPLSDVHFMSPISLFASVHKSSDSSTFFQSLFNWHNFGVALRELVIMGPVAGGSWLVQRARRNRWQRASAFSPALRRTAMRRNEQAVPVTLHSKEPVH